MYVFDMFYCTTSMNKDDDLKRHFSFAIQAPNSAVRTRGHTFKLKTTRYRLNIAQNLFFNRVVSTSNGLPIE